MSTFTRYFDLYFTTCTVLDWRPIFKKQKNIDSILEALNFLHDNERAIIYAFVIMPNHIHLLYQVVAPFTDSKVKHSFLGVTAKSILKNLSSSEKNNFLVEKSNRKYQIWKSPSLSVEIFSPKFATQKLNYINDNPRRAKLEQENGEYLYCSSRSYLNGKSEFSFLTLW